MKTIRLSKAVVKKIWSAVDRVFDRAVARFLAKPPADKRVFIGVKSRVTLPQLFEAASAEEHARADKSTLDSLLAIAEGYVEAQRHATKARVVKAVESWLNEAHAGGVDTDVATVLGGELAGVWKTAADGMHKIVASESNIARNTGALDGIVKFSNARGIEDPVVFFVVVRDDTLCGECRRLHLMPDGVTPRLWHLSEVAQGYHKKGDERPSLGGLHPHCRCSLATMSPGFGFDESGMVTYVSPEHDEMAKQGG